MEATGQHHFSNETSFTAAGTAALLWVRRIYFLYAPPQGEPIIGQHAQTGTPRRGARPAGKHTKLSAHTFTCVAASTHLCTGYVQLNAQLFVV